MIVIDASAVVSGLLNDGPARLLLARERLHVPHLVDTEVTSALRRQVLAGNLGADSAWTALGVWRRLAVTRHPAHGLLGRVWQLRHNLSGYDATYVALAEGLGCSLATLDARLAQRSRDYSCPVTVVPV